MFMMTAAVGMRVSEVAGLTISDVRDADGSLKLPTPCWKRLRQQQ
jgi:site-specific recombinase XerD